MRLALKIDEVERKARKEHAEDVWARAHAKDLELDLSDDEAGGKKGKKKKGGDDDEDYGLNKRQVGCWLWTVFGQMCGGGGLVMYGEWWQGPVHLCTLQGLTHSESRRI